MSRAWMKRTTCGTIDVGRFVDAVGSMQVKGKGSEMAVVRGAIPTGNQTVAPVHVVKSIRSARWADDFGNSQLTAVKKRHATFQVGQRDPFRSLHSQRVMSDHMAQRLEVGSDVGKVPIDHSLMPRSTLRRWESWVWACEAKSQSNHAASSASLPA